MKEINNQTIQETDIKPTEPKIELKEDLKSLKQNKKQQLNNFVFKDLFNTVKTSDKEELVLLLKELKGCNKDALEQIFSIIKSNLLAIFQGL